MDKHQLTQNIKNFLLGERKMDLVGVCPAGALAEEPEGRRPTDILGCCRSVIVFGHIEIVTDREKICGISRLLCYKFTDDEKYIEEEIRRSGPRTFMFALVPEHITGKLVNEA